MKIIRYFHRNFNYIYFILFYIIIHYFFFLIIIKILALSRLYIRYHFINWICGFIHICKNKWKKKKIRLFDRFTSNFRSMRNRTRKLVIARTRVLFQLTGSGLLFKSTKKSVISIRPSRTTVCKTKPYFASTFSFFKTPRDITDNCNTSTSSTGLPKFQVKLWKEKKKRRNYSRANFFNFFFWLYIFSTLSTIHEIQTNKKC